MLEYVAVPYDVMVTPTFRTWWDELSTEQQEDITARVELLADVGPTLGRPTVDRVHGSAFHNMKELRCSSGGDLRVLFAFDPQRQAVLLVGGNKSGQWDSWYAEAIPQADELFAEHLRDMKQGGVS